MADDNARYHGLILRALPAGATDVLDVGCGTGALTRSLRGTVAHVVGVDRDARSIQVAQTHPGAADVEYVEADFLSAPPHQFAAAAFDAVVSIAALHHMDAAAALARMKRLVRPGGVIAIVGLARSDALADYLMDAAGFVAGFAARLGRGGRDTGQPAESYLAPRLWPPPLTYRETRRVIEDVLSGAVYRRHARFRYSAVWRAPG